MVASRMRRLIERLPGPANLTPLVKFTIIQTGNYKTFARQCSDKNRSVAQSCRGRRSTGSGGSNTERTTRAEALSWEPLGRRYHCIVTCVYLYLLIKYRLVSLISDEFGYLDCLALGRFRFIGRTNKISGEILIVFTLCFLLYRWTIHLYVPNFKFFALEFLISDGHQTRRSNYLGGRGLEPFNARLANDSGVVPSSLGGDNEYMKQFYGANRPKSPETVAPVDSIAYLRNPFDMQQDRWILRPNRTRESWLTLSLWTKGMLYCTVSTLVLWPYFGTLVIGGSITSNLGFEMSYPACVSWLRNIQSARQSPDGWLLTSNNSKSQYYNDYSHIYLAPRVLAHEIPIDDVPARIPLSTRDLRAATLYTMVRILADTAENLLFFLESLLLFMAQLFLLATSSLDVILNANAIRVRLLSLLDKLETRMNIRHQEATRAKCYSCFIEGARTDYYHHHHYRDLPLSSNLNYKRMSVNTLTSDWTSNHAHQFSHRRRATTCREVISLDCFNEQLQDEIVELQAILADHFYTITRGYNLNVSFTIGMMGFCWLLYTATICIWMSSVRSRAIELEFVVAEASVTLFCLALTVGAALVRSRNLQLYGLITRAMALDPDHSLTKLRWTSILKFFYPKPFHCFTIFSSTELSVLLGLKIISWILSAFIVLANFFYTSRL